MDEKRFSITLADGTSFQNLRLNGNNFISDTPIDATAFEYNCSPLIVSDGENQEIHEHAALVQITAHGSEHWVVIRDLLPDELSRIKIQSDIEYLAMMTGVEL